MTKNEEFGEVYGASVSRNSNTGEYFIHSIASGKDGPGYSSAPFYRLPANTSSELIVQSIQVALKNSRIRTDSGEGRVGLETVLREFGLRKKTDLYRNMKDVSVSQKGGEIRFLSSRNTGRSFVNMSEPNTKFVIPENSSSEVFYETLLQAFDNCT